MAARIQSQSTNVAGGGGPIKHKHWDLAPVYGYCVQVTCSGQPAYSLREPLCLHLPQSQPIWHLTEFEDLFPFHNFQM